MKSGITKITKTGDSKMVIIPARVFSDSTFPFKVGEKLNCKIEKNKVVLYA